MKRAAVLILCLCFLFQFLSGCAKNETTPSGSDSSTTQSESTDPSGETSSDTQPGESQSTTPTGTTEPVDPGGTPGTSASRVLSGVVALPQDGIGIPGVDFKELATGPVDGWDDKCPAPYFNPLGTRSLYSGTGADSRISSWRVETLDGYTPKEFVVQGSFWNLKIQHADLTRNWILYKARELNAVIYQTSLDKVAFHIMEDDATRWWVIGELNMTSSIPEVYFRIYKTHFAPCGQTVTIKPADHPGQTTYELYTDCVPGKLQSVTVTLKGQQAADCGVTIRANQPEYINGVYRSITSQVFTTINWGITSPVMGDTFIYDNVPILDGMILWTFDWNTQGTAMPEEMTFSISEVADVPEIDWGDQIGLVKIIGSVNGGGARLKNAWDINVRHAVYDQHYTLASPWQDEDGNYCFAAPAGYYTLSLAENVCRAGNTLVNSGQIQLVPVSAGQVTTITIPSEILSTYGELAKNHGGFSSRSSSIDIQTSVDNGTTAQIALVVNDPLERELSPALEDFTIKENGLDGKVVKVEKAPGSADVMLVLDSSGSMKGNMEAAVAAAKLFVDSLPDNSTVSLIQFADKAVLHPGSTKADVQAALDKVKADGSTVMYDAAILAMQTLAGKKRPYIVIFSDGADSSEPGVSGNGSKATLDQVIAQIKTSKATVLTIGFGATHDPKALMAMSGASENGAYYVAADQSALDSAFSAVSTKFGNQFLVTYERPTALVDTDSDVPVVSIMMDTSGSMNMDPSASPEDVDYRLDRVKNLFHDFILDLPSGALMQFNTFFTPTASTPNSHFIQLTTDQKAPVLRGIASVQAGGGTPIVEALQTALLELKPVPSSKKVLVFFTDAALSVKDDGSGAQQAKFDEVLSSLKKAGIRVLFAGLGNAEYAQRYDAVFKHAADLAGGEYIITASVVDIAAKLDALLAKINTPLETAASGISLSVALNCRADDGSQLNDAAVKDLGHFAVRQAAGQTLTPGFVTVDVTNELYNPYDREASQLLYGSDSPTEESIITMRLPFTDKNGSNVFSKLTVRQAYFMHVFKGIKAAAGQQYLALDVSLAFQKTDASRPETAYCIPSIFNHFYVSCNGGRMMPASQATWLAEQPIAIPGEASITVSQLAQEAPQQGVLVFMVDKLDRDELAQLSLHLYDSDYGHINIPLVGGMPDTLLAIQDLPQTAPANIADAFSLKATGLTDVTKLAGVELTQYAKEKNTTFRVIEAAFDSKVQALLNINPIKRFYYAIDTDSGTLLTQMSDIVYNLPLGFTGDTMLAPGSTSKVRMPYVLPSALLAAKATLVGDLQRGSFALPLNDGLSYATASIKQQSFDHAYFTLTINAITPMTDRSRTVVLDFTVADKPDGMGTSGFDAILTLAKNDAADSQAVQTAVNRKGIGGFGNANLEGQLSQKGILMPDLVATRNLLFGASSASDTWGVLDGQSRRGILLFNLPGSSAPSEWSLTSSLLPDLKFMIQNAAFGNPELLSDKPVVSIDLAFQNILREAVDAAVSRYRATHPSSNQVPEVALADEDLMGNQTASPALTLYGSQVIERVQTDQDFHHVMDSLDWIPAPNNYTNVFYAPESVITQGWGTQYDLFNLARILLSRLGYRPEQRMFKLTRIGKDNLVRLYGVKTVPDTLPALAYFDSEGHEKVYVPVLGHDISEMNGLGVLNMQNTWITPVRSTIRVTAVGELTGGAAAATQQALVGGFGDILGGSEGNQAGSPISETVPLLEAEFDLDQVGLDIFDLGFMAVGKSEDGVHDKVTVIAQTRAGTLVSPNLWIDTASYNLTSITAELTTPIADGRYKTVTHTIDLTGQDSLTGLFMSIAYNTPELTTEAAAAYEAAIADEAASAESSATDYAVDRWFGHASLNRLIKTLTDRDNELCTELNVVTGRRTNPIALAFTLQQAGDQYRASIDLMNHTNQVIEGEPADARSYRLMLGLFASQAEAGALANDQGRSYLDVWASLPDTAGFIVVDSDIQERQRAAVVLREQGFPERLCTRLATARDGMENIAFIIPTAAGTVDGAAQWAWLELDTQTFDLVSMFDNGERSGMVSYVLGMKPKNAAEFADGALVGIACSDVAIATYSLSLSNYQDIQRCAAGLAIFVYKVIKLFQDYTDQVGGLTSNPLEYVTGQAKDAALGAVKERTKINVDELYKLYEGKPGEPKFADGFKEAVERYFHTTIKD